MNESSTPKLSVIKYNDKYYTGDLLANNSD